MVVRIRLGKGPRVERKRRKNRRLALAAAVMLTPGAVLAAVLGLWRLAADLRWTASFAIHDGLFSHWQVWLAFAALLQAVSRLLNRYAHADDSAA